MEAIIAFTVCIAIVAAGDILSIVTKAKLPAMSGIVLLYLLATALGMPKNFPEISGLAAMGNIMFPLFVAALTTNVMPLDFVKEWRFILVGCFSVVFAMSFTMLICGFFIDSRELFAGAVVTCGGAFTGGMLVMDYAKKIGFTELIALPLLLATTLDLVGQPIGSLIMRKCVRRILVLYEPKTEKDDENNNEQKCNRYGQPFNSSENPSPWFGAVVPPQYETEAVALFKLMLSVCLAYWIGESSGLGWAFVLVILGLVGSFLGFFRMNMMERTRSSGLIMCAIFGMVFQMVNDLEAGMIIDRLIPFCIIVAVSCTGLILGGMLGAKIFGYDIWLGAACAIGLFYFFPGIQNIITEVARSCTGSREEHDYVIEKVSSPAIITAFVGSRFCLLAAALLLPKLI